MTRDTRTRLRDLARHRRDEQAASVRNLEARLDEIDESVTALAGEIEHCEIAARERLADPFERQNTALYVARLRERREALATQRIEVAVERDEVRKRLEERVIEHRQMDHLVHTAEFEQVTERERRSELESDDLASGHWFKVREENDRD
jgi:flagellar biosynthesis chaperone FliJ